MRNRLLNRHLTLIKATQFVKIFTSKLGLEREGTLSVGLLSSVIKDRGRAGIDGKDNLVSLIIIIQVLITFAACRLSALWVFKAAYKYFCCAGSSIVSYLQSCHSIVNIEV